MLTVTGLSHYIACFPCERKSESLRENELFGYSQVSSSKFLLTLDRAELALFRYTPRFFCEAKTETLVGSQLDDY